jgi:hypothetical protein
MYEDGGVTRIWQPLTIDEVQERFAAVRVSWWIAGGHAIDLFVGWVTRPHDDIDVEMFRKDSEILFDVFPGWNLATVSPQGLSPWHPGATIPPDVFGVWGRPTPAEPWAIEVMLAGGDETTWRLRTDPEITLPGAHLVRSSRTGIPYGTPEVQMLYKSKMARTKDDTDMARVLYLMSEPERRWLANSISRSDPENPWIDLLNMPHADHHE